MPLLIEAIGAALYNPHRAANARPLNTLSGGSQAAGNMERYVCIHGHFYQPPRENPWLESVELQDSATPFHDWNERITHECYGRNTAARIFDGEGRIDAIVNNYSKISFNFGPTLLTWMKDKMPWVHDAIIEADRQSQEKFSGH